MHQNKIVHGERLYHILFYKQATSQANFIQGHELLQGMHRKHNYLFFSLTFFEIVNIRAQTLNIRERCMGHQAKFTQCPSSCPNSI